MNESNNAIYDKQLKHAQTYMTFHESELHWLRLILDKQIYRTLLMKPYCEIQHAQISYIYSRMFHMWYCTLQVFHLITFSVMFVIFYLLIWTVYYLWLRSKYNNRNPSTLFSINNSGIALKTLLQYTRKCTRG